MLLEERPIKTIFRYGLSRVSLCSPASASELTSRSRDFAADFRLLGRRLGRPRFTAATGFAFGFFQQSAGRQLNRFQQADYEIRKGSIVVGPRLRAGTLGRSGGTDCSRVAFVLLDGVSQPTMSATVATRTTGTALTTIATGTTSTVLATIATRTTGTDFAAATRTVTAGTVVHVICCRDVPVVAIVFGRLDPLAVVADDRRRIVGHESVVVLVPPDYPFGTGFHGGVKRLENRLEHRVQTTVAFALRRRRPRREKKFKKPANPNNCCSCAII